MNPNDLQAVEEEEVGVQETEADIDYDALYGGMDVDVGNVPKSKELENSYAEIFKDIGKQGAKELLIGAGGAYGDLLDLLGLQPKEELPGKQARNKAEFEILEKMQQPGYKPSFSDIYMLSGDDDIAPDYSRLPSSEDLRGFNEMVGGPGEAENWLGLE
jgi:hypothetical protein